MLRDWQTYLWDALASSDAILRFTANYTLSQYLGDEMLRAAVERHFTIIGEALGQAFKLNPELARRIPELGRVVGFRNVLVHAYPLVEPSTVYLITQEDLPVLQNSIKEILDSLVEPPR